MKLLQTMCLLAMLSFAIGCKKEAKEPVEPTVEQKEQGTLPESSVDSVPPAPDSTATDTVKPA